MVKGKKKRREEVAANACNEPPLADDSEPPSSRRRSFTRTRSRKSVDFRRRYLSKRKDINIPDPPHSPPPTHIPSSPNNNLQAAVDQNIDTSARQTPSTRRANGTTTRRHNNNNNYHRSNADQHDHPRANGAGETNDFHQRTRDPSSRDTTPRSSSNDHADSGVRHSHNNNTNNNNFYSSSSNHERQSKPVIPPNLPLNMNAAAALSAAAASLSGGRSVRGGTTTEEDSTEWLSHIIEEMWPYASSIAEDVFKGYIEPALVANMPSMFPQLRFTRIHLGTRPPRVENVTVNSGSENHSDLVAVEADLSFDGDPHIELCVGPPGASFTCGVTNLRFKGRAELLVRPLLPRLPLIGAAQAAFVNPPVMEWNLTGAARWADIDLFKKTFQRVTNQVVAALCVLPNRVSFKMDPKVDFLAYVAHPIGVLRVAVLQGADFPNTDDNALLWRKHLAAPDVYITLQHGGTVKTTHRVDDACDPKYTNQVFDFVLTSTSKYQTVIVKAWDYDMGKTDKLLGYAHVKVSDLVENRLFCVKLQGAPFNAHPTVTLMGRILPLSSELSRVQTAILTQRADTMRPPSCSRLLCTVNISEATNLPSHAARPFVRLCIGREVKFETWCSYKTADPDHIAPVVQNSLENPKFDCSFHALLGGPIDSESRVDLAVIDQKSGKTLGTAFALLSDFVFRRKYMGAYVFALLNCDRPDCTLRASIKLDAVLDSPPLWTIAAQIDEDTLADPANYTRAPQ